MEPKQEVRIITFQIPYPAAAAEAKGRRKLSFTTEKSLPLRSVFLDFCDQAGLVYSNISFVHRGVLINDKQTPEGAQIENGDVIDTFFGVISGESKLQIMKKESGMITFQILIQEAGIGKRTLSFMTEKNLPLRRVFLDFCDQLDFVYGTIRFLQCDGRQVNERQTPEECEIEDGDCIDAFHSLKGGGIPLSS